MDKKYLLIIGVIAIIIISGCVQQTVGPETAFGSYIEFEATVVSLSVNQSGNYSGIEMIITIPEANVPRDSAVIRIDKIIGTGPNITSSSGIESAGPSKFNWSSIGFEEGNEINVSFEYTARPAKIITVVGQTTQTGEGNYSVVSSSIVPTTITFENGYFVFRINGNTETQTILPGLEEGVKFRTRLWDNVNLTVGTYTII